MKRLLCGLPLVFLLCGCFETYEGALAVRTEAATVAWSVADGFGPTLIFRVANDDTDAEAVDVTVRVRVDVLAGAGDGDPEDIELLNPPAGVSGSDGDYLIASIPALSSQELRLRVASEPGIYRWTVQVDVGDAVEEFDERDNTAVVTVTVSQPPLGTVNLAFNEEEALTASPEGDTINLSVPIVVTRPAGDVIPLLRVHVYSQGRDIYTRWYLPDVAVGESTIEISGPAPAGGAGWMEIELDATDFIDETDENDNLRSFDFPLGGGG